MGQNGEERGQVGIMRRGYRRSVVSGVGVCPVGFVGESEGWSKIYWRGVWRRVPSVGEGGGTELTLLERSEEWAQ